MAAVLMNPGTAPVPRASERLAWANVRAFCAALGPGVRARRKVERDDGAAGRWLFVLRHGRRSVSVVMPGCPRNMLVEPLRQGVVIPYRLYVDGNSWYWRFALEIASEHLRLPAPTTSPPPGT
jgi:hypothetical protein